MEKIFVSSYIKKIGFVTAIILVSFYIGKFWGASQARQEITVKQLRLNQNNVGKYQFINPLLGCLIGGSNEDSSDYILLKNKLQDYIHAKIADANVENISVYFDTRDGKWLGINTDEKYVPASLLKVANMIAIYKKAESNPNFLSQQILFTPGQTTNDGEYFKSAEELITKKLYTVDDLVSHMIIFSDNTPIEKLMGMLSDSETKEIYTDLGLTLPQGVSNNAVDFMTVKSYANFFRVLYNSTYLNREMSEKALALLSQTKFSQGIRAGVPQGVTVSDKFGERSIENQAGVQSNKELHDCGIVYFPQHPYLLCIMTRGKNFDAQANVLKDISQMSYQFMTENFKK